MPDIERNKNPQIVLICSSILMLIKKIFQIFIFFNNKNIIQYLIFNLNKIKNNIKVTSNLYYIKEKKYFNLVHFFLYNL